MSGEPNLIVDYETGPISFKGLPVTSNGAEEEKKAFGHSVTVATTVRGEVATTTVEGHEVEVDGRDPTPEEILTLRLVPAAMPWAAIGMCIVEFAERASYYGCTGVFANFIRGALPIGGNGAGAVAPGALGLNESAGALGLGTQTSSALTVLFTFLAYTIPILGGIIADTRWGRYKTICVGVLIGVISHCLLVIPAIPSVIASGHALAPFIIALLILAFASGFIKPCLGPLLCDQSPVKKQTVITLKSGELVILDPATTVSRYLLIFYWAINIGAFFQLATTYAEHDVGFWLAYLLPGIIYMLVPIVLVLLYKKIYKAPPQGSVLVEASSVVRRLFANGGWKTCWKGGQSWWDRAKPTNILIAEGSIDEKKVFWDDRFVDELKQSFSACKVFLLIPIFTLADGGIGNAENAMSVAMTNNGVPNDLISNFNSLTIVVFAPLMNFWFYPWMRKMGYPLKPMTRMSIGFFLASMNMVIAAILQWRIYETSPCGYEASTCDGVSPVNLWWQIPLYALPAIGEIFVNVTSYELAYTRAPARMKGLVYAAVLFNTALASALAEIVNPSLVDPYFTWTYVALAVACFLCCFAFPIFFKDLNEPLTSFADVDRMEGAKQPLAIAAAEKSEYSSEEKDLEKK